MGFFVFMTRFPFRPYSYINVLSLDIAIGAVISSCLINRALQVSPSIHHYLVLGLSVWIIYTLDHLLDARRVKHAATDRHRFHQRHFKPMALVLFVLTVVNLILALSLPAGTIEAGIGLSLVAGLYLLFQHRLYFFKEMAGAVFYTAGVSLPAIVTRHYDVSIGEVLTLTHLAVVAWTNLLVFSFFDILADQHQGQVSFATQWGERTTRHVIVFMFVLSLVLFMLERSTFQTGYGWIWLTMSVILCSMTVFKEFFLRHDRYRLVGDAVFFLPVVVCWL